VADLSKLTYSHDGSEPTGTPDSFNMRITDSGGGTGVPLSHTSTIEIGIIGNNNDPVLVTNIPQTLTGTTTSLTITPGMLQVTDSDSPDPNLTYTLTAVPSLTDGYFTLDGTRLVVGASFTQDDIASGRLSYTSLSTTPRIDSMSFTVKDGDRRLYPTPRDGGIYVPGTDTLAVNTFNINVQSTVPDSNPVPPDAPVNDAPSTGGSNAAALLEGQTLVLDNTQLTASDPDTVAAQLVYRVLSLPTSGSIRLNGVALEYFDSFTQADVDAGRQLCPCRRRRLHRRLHLLGIRRLDRDSRTQLQPDHHAPERHAHRHQRQPHLRARGQQHHHHAGQHRPHRRRQLGLRQRNRLRRRQHPALPDHRQRHPRQPQAQRREPSAWATT
jgi:hypothetical protein